MVMQLIGPALWLDLFEVSIDEVVFYVLAAVSAINLVLALALLILGCIFKQDTPGSSTNFYIAIGGLAIVGCVVIQGLSPFYVSYEIQDNLCQCYPTLLCYGMIAMIGGLLVRSGAIFSFYRKESNLKAQPKEWQANMWMLFLLLIEAAPLLAWIMMFDLRGIRMEQIPVDYTMCTSDEYEWFKLGLSAYHAFLILLAAILVWPAIYFSKKTPSEIDANLVCAAVFNMLFAVAAGVVVYILYDTTPTIMYAITGGILQYVVFVTLGLLIAAKLCVAQKLKGGAGEGPYSHMDHHGE